MIQTAVPMDENPSGFISEYVEGLSTALWPINITIHDNPELNYEEFIAHETLTSFLKTREGWDVIPSAFGIPTSFKAEYASGKPGPVVSFNAEYGEQEPFKWNEPH
jgi:metal-dependent amidase/aminoacylase/carboxypeptidase family protein